MICHVEISNGLSYIRLVDMVDMVDMVNMVDESISDYRAYKSW